VKTDHEIADFWRDAIGCRRCPTIAPWRKFPPERRGTARYRLMLIGEAPGRISLENERPFSNPRNLVIRQAFSRAFGGRELEDALYMTDAVKCWPSSESGANRSPRSRELKTCLELHLLREVEIIKPRLIVAFGRMAASAVITAPFDLFAIHGTIVEGPGGMRVLPLTHPSTANIAGMRRVGVRSIAEYEDRLVEIFRLNLGPLLTAA
jgi:uracil-DNA glycosylase family 4